MTTPEGRSVHQTLGNATLFTLHWRRFIFSSSLVLTLISFGVAWHSGHYEPFYGFQWSEAIVQIGIAIPAFMLSVAVLLWTIGGVITSKISGLWLWLGLWNLLTILLLSFCIAGYLIDLNKF